MSATPQQLLAIAEARLAISSVSERIAILQLQRATEQVRSAREAFDHAFAVVQAEAQAAAEAKAMDALSTAPGAPS